mmetsp:Transcript_90532/g.252012  ORF Transcript_90532/g.252012 Transcript_90532/m.252012 type:complete len:401 (+) Transcript_90532:320-1522(+)
MLGPLPGPRHLPRRHQDLQALQRLHLGPGAVQAPERRQLQRLGLGLHQLPPRLRRVLHPVLAPGGRRQLQQRRRWLQQCRRQRQRWRQQQQQQRRCQQQRRRLEQRRRRWRVRSFLVLAGHGWPLPGTRRHLLELPDGHHLLRRHQRVRRGRQHAPGPFDCGHRRDRGRRQRQPGRGRLCERRGRDHRRQAGAGAGDGRVGRRAAQPGGAPCLGRRQGGLQGCDSRHRQRGRRAHRRTEGAPGCDQRRPGPQPQGARRGQRQRQPQRQPGGQGGRQGDDPSGAAGRRGRRGRPGRRPRGQRRDRGRLGRRGGGRRGRRPRRARRHCGRLCRGGAPPLGRRRVGSQGDDQHRDHGHTRAHHQGHHVHARRARPHDAHRRDLGPPQLGGFHRQQRPRRMVID